MSQAATNDRAWRFILVGLSTLLISIFFIYPFLSDFLQQLRPGTSAYLKKGVWTGHVDVEQLREDGSLAPIQGGRMTIIFSHVLVSPRNGEVDVACIRTNDGTYKKIQLDGSEAILDWDGDPNRLVTSDGGQEIEGDWDKAADPAIFTFRTDKEAFRIEGNLQREDTPLFSWSLLQRSCKA